MTSKATPKVTEAEAEAIVTEAEAEATRTVSPTDSIGGGQTLQGLITGMARYAEQVGETKAVQFQGMVEAMDELRTLLGAAWTEAVNAAKAESLSADLKVSTWISGLKSKAEAAGLTWSKDWRASNVETAVTIWSEHKPGVTDEVFGMACSPLVPKGQKRLSKTFTNYVDFLFHFKEEHYDDKGGLTEAGAAWYAAKEVRDRAKGQFMFDPERVLPEEGDDEEAIITNAFKLANDIIALARMRAAKSADYKGVESKVRKAARAS